MAAMTTKGARSAAIVLLATLLNGCVSGMVVRAVTWPGDPGRFWVVMRDTGLQVDPADNPDNESEGECTVVWNGTLIEGMRLESFAFSGTVYRDSGDTLGCAWSYLDSPGASTTWLHKELGYFDLSMPKNARRGPTVLDQETLLERAGYLPVVLQLKGFRFGTSPICKVTIEPDTLWVVSNAGVNKDVHVYVGTGSRECYSSI